MLHKGMAVIIRDKDELEAFAQAANKKGYSFSTLDIRDIRVPVRISCNVNLADNRCLSKCQDIYYPLKAGITEVVEASDFFRNQLISIRRKYANTM